MSFSRDDLLELPFVALGDTVDYWHVSTTEGYSEDCALGRQYASMLVAFMREHDAPTLLSWVMQAMADSGRRTGVETAFITEIAERALFCSKKAHPLAGLDDLAPGQTPDCGRGKAVSRDLGVWPGRLLESA